MRQARQVLSAYAPDALKELARKYWAKHRPSMYEKLMRTGFLDVILERAVEFTLEEMRELERRLRGQGYTDREAREQAWHALRAKWIFLPREKEGYARLGSPKGPKA